MNTGPAGATLDPTTHSYRWVMLGGVWLVYFCFGLTIAQMAPLVGDIKRDLGLNNSEMGTILGAWPLVYIATAIPCGALLDRIGARRALALAGFIIALSGVMRGLSDSYLTLFLAVGLFALGGPFISIGAPKLITLCFTGKDRGLAMGIYVTGPAIGGVAALALTNSVVMPLTGYEWRSVLFVYAAVGLLAGLIWTVIATHPLSHEAERQMKAAGGGQSSLRVFVSLLQSPSVRAVILMGMSLLFVFHGLSNWMPQILLGYGMDAATAGFWAAIPTAVGIVGVLVIPRLATPDRRITVLVSLGICLGFATLLMQSDSRPVLFMGLVLQGISWIAMTTTMTLAMVELRDVGPNAVGTAVGLFYSAGQIGGVMGPVAVGFLSDVTGGFSAPLFMLTAMCGVLVLLTGRLRALTR